MSESNWVRQVSSEAIVSALDSTASTKRAAEIAGCSQELISWRSRKDPAVRAALARAAAVRRARRAAELAMAKALAEGEREAERARRLRIVGELASRYEGGELDRDALIVAAHGRGLTLAEVGRIVGRTRECVRQNEVRLGLRRRKGAAAS